MPRKKIIYTSDLPYHVHARANNRERFCLPKHKMWNVFIFELNQIVAKYKAMIHAFVLMDNHYHLLITTHPEFDLGYVMCELQKSVSRRTNLISGRINHVFGGTYKPSLITDAGYYLNVYKYIYRNPIQAGICNSVCNYKYSSFTQADALPLASPTSGITVFLPRSPIDTINWINESFENSDYDSIKKGLKKTVFKPVKPRHY